MSAPAPRPHAPDPGRDRRRVGAFALLALGINGIVGVGIFFAPADIAAGAPGWTSVAVVALTGLLLAPVALAFAVLGRRFDEDGGPVVFARAAFGELASFLVGWVAYVSAIASTAAVIFGLTASVAPVFGLETPFAVRSAATLLVTTLALLTALGISFSARAWTTLTVLKLLPLAGLVGAYLWHGAPGSAAATPEASGPWTRAALTAVFTFQGFEIVPVVAGQVRAPGRVIPMATLGSLALSAALYVGLQSACVAALPALASSQAPLVEAAAVWGGARLAELVRLGTSVSALGIAVGMVATTPRYLSAVARGGTLALGLDREGARGVPLRALFTTWLLVTILIQASTRGELFALSSVAVLMQYVVTALSLLALARRAERGLRPAHAWIAVPAVIVGTALTAGAQAREWVVAGIALALGLGLRALARIYGKASLRSGSS